VIVAWWFYWGKQAQIAVGAWQALSSFLRLPLPFLPFRYLVANPPPPLYLFSTVLSSRATSSERGLRLSGTGAA